MPDGFQFTNGSKINCLTCAADLVAIGDAHSLTVLHIHNTNVALLATFFVGTPVNNLAFSPRTVSPSADGTNWRLQLAIACADGHIRICAQSANDSEPVVQVVSNSATTHQDVITSLAFSGSSAGRYLASTSLDRTCIIWDLGQEEDSAAGSIAFATRFAHPLLSVSAHHKHAEFLVADNSGNIFLFDWAATGRAPVQLIDPRALADARTGAKAVGIGSAAWKSHDSDCVGAVFGSRWIVWHFTQGAGGGGKPVLSGNTLLDGGCRFRWSPTEPAQFAVCSPSSTHGAVVHLLSTQYPTAAPTVISVEARPNRVSDFDFLPSGILAVAVGRRVYFVPASVNNNPSNIALAGPTVTALHSHSQLQL